MSNKTIYVSESDEKLFEDAKTLAGEALSSVIARALREYVTRHTEHEKGMKEITLKVGLHDTEREQHFVGTEIGKWSGFSDDEEWWLEAKIYRTQKGSLAVYLTNVCKASLLVNPALWRMGGEYLIDSRRADLFVGKGAKDFEGKLPKSLISRVKEMEKRYEVPVEYLDI